MKLRWHEAETTRDAELINCSGEMANYSFDCGATQSIIESQKPGWIDRK
jgi:hypothetical protein